jgi:hypothetical protein
MLNWIFVWNVNGMFVKKVQISFQIVTWCTWTSVLDFDWLLIADDNGKIYATEVFYLELGKPVWEARDQIEIVSVTYIPDEEIAGIVMADGQINIVGLSFE